MVLNIAAGIQLKRGVAYSLYGDNASGKSTLILLLSGHLEAPKFTVTIDGKQKSRNPTTLRALGLTVCHQNDRLFPSLSIWKNVWLGAPRVLNIRGKQDSEARNWLIDKFKMLQEAHDKLKNISIDDPFQELSGGFRVIVRLMRAIAWDFKVLLLDEPTAGLSEATKQSFFELLKGKLTQDKTALFVSHIPKEHEQLASHLEDIGIEHITWSLIDGSIQ